MTHEKEVFVTFTNLRHINILLVFNDLEKTFDPNVCTFDLLGCIAAGHGGFQHEHSAQISLTSSQLEYKSFCSVCNYRLT